jgi:hypothetical protein
MKNICHNKQLILNPKIQISYNQLKNFDIDEDFCDVIKRLKSLMKSKKNWNNNIEAITYLRRLNKFKKTIFYACFDVFYKKLNEKYLNSTSSPLILNALTLLSEVFAEISNYSNFSLWIKYFTPLVLDMISSKEYLVQEESKKIMKLITKNYTNLIEKIKPININQDEKFDLMELKKHINDSSESSFNSNDIKNKYFGKIKNNLLNEIFNYLPIENRINCLMNVEKRFLYTLIEQKYFHIIKLDFLSVENIYFNLYDKTIDKFADFDIHSDFMNDILAYIYKFQMKYLVCLNFNIFEFLNHPQIIIYICSALKTNKTISYLIIDFYYKNSINEDIFLFNDVEFIHSNISFFIEKLSDCLSTNKSIKSLKISIGILGKNELNMRMLSESIKMNQVIESLSLEENSLGENPKNLKYLCDALLINSTIKQIILNSNNIYINSENYLYLYDIIKNNTTIKYLSLNNNNLGFYPLYFKLLVDGLIENEVLCELSLSGNDLGNDKNNVECLVKLIKNSNVEKIDILDLTLLEHNIRKIINQSNKEIVSDFE